MLEGKTVNITNVGLLQTFYPDYCLREELMYDNENKVIYVGKPRKGLMGDLRESTGGFINTVGAYDYDLDDNGVLALLVYSKWGKELKKEDMDYFMSMGRYDFEQLMKTYWVAGVTHISVVGDGVSFFTLYKSILGSKNELLSVYFKLLDKYSPKEIESGLLTFIERAYREDIEVSGKYRKILDDFRLRRGSKLKPLLNAYRIDDRPIEIKLLYFLLLI